MKHHRIVAGCLAGVAAMSMLGVSSAHAASRYDNSLPYETGCNKGSFVAGSKAINGGTISMRYSPACGTNWVEWRGEVRSILSGMTLPLETAWEQDQGTWAYSRQVYAPGTSTARGEIRLNTPTSYEAWAIACTRTCEFVKIY